jgi:glycosyltransferase involved in cell wall biosynthesis
MDRIGDVVMNSFLARVVRKISYETHDFGTKLKMLTHPQRYYEYTEAKAFLQSISPIPEGKCWSDDGYQNAQRTCDLSLIVPAYNVEKTIDTCLESILNQNVSFSYEVIVVNDGSKDKTATLLQKYEQDDRFRVIHQENGGLSAARNRGIDCARGEYLCFVDSDDVLPDGALECLMGIALEKKAKIVVGSLQKCLSTGKILYTQRLKDQKANLGGLPGFAWGNVIHYSVFQNLRFPEGYWFEDSIIAQIVYPLCQDAIYTTSHVCYTYYSNDSGMTAIANGNPKSIDSLWLTASLLEERVKYGLSSTQSFYEYYLSMVKLTYQRTKQLGPQVAQCIFTVQRRLMEHNFDGDQIECSPNKRQIQEALRTNNFRKYILACERKN